MFLFPSSSTVSNKPSETVAIKAGNGNYRAYVKDTASNTEYDATYFCKYFDLKDGVSINGYSRWGIIAAASRLNVNVKYFMVRVDESNI